MIFHHLWTVSQMAEEPKLKSHYCLYLSVVQKNNCPARQEGSQVPSLGQRSLRVRVQPSRALPGENPWSEKPVPQLMGQQQSDTANDKH